MIFFNAYRPDMWEGYVKNGFVRENSGIRFCQCLFNDEDLKFNNLAKKDGELYNILKEKKIPFYIDRLQGGCYIENYPYDMELVEEYDKLLGDKFWGFQMHEWMSNYTYDIFVKLDKISKDDWNEENIENTIREAYPGKYLNIESMTLKEMADAGKPETFDEFYDNITGIYKNRVEKMGKILPVDSFALAYGFELSAGSNRIAPEVGGQISNGRTQICYARGMLQKGRI